MGTSKLLGKDKKHSAFGSKSSKGAGSQAVHTMVDRKQQVVDGVNYYMLEDWQGQRVKGRFHEPQLQKAQVLQNRRWHVVKKLKIIQGMWTHSTSVGELERSGTCL